MTPTATDKQCCIAPASDTVQLVQLTDTHLGRLPGTALLGVDTDRSLQLVIERVLRERPGIDLVLATGDLSDRGSHEAYTRLTGYLERLPATSCWLPGNHDDREQMLAVVGDSGRMCAEVAAGGWQVLMLDSQVPGEVGGCLGEAELARLRSALERADSAGQYTLVCLHHQPVPVGCAWLDEQMVADADAFWAVLDGFPRVRGVLWGHVHQQLDRRRGEVALMASPSTCVQFAPGSEDFQADSLPPGYRWLDLHADGSIATGVSRVTDATFCVDLDSGGYL